jgi:hypothetical protein
MSRRPTSGVAALAAAALFVALLGAAGIVLAQTVAGPLGVADATARKLIVGAVLGDLYRTYESPSASNDFIQTVARAYAKLPAAARGPATTAAFAWAKRYVSSPAFAAAYAEQREGQRPAGVESVPSVDDQIKKMMDEQAANLVMARKMAESIPEKDRAAFLASLKEQEAQANSPERLKMLRAALEAERGENASRSSASGAAWEARYPANPNAFVREHLQRFLTETARVDYSLAVVFVRGPGGDVIGFLNPGYTGIPWQHVHAIVAGKDAVDAARAAAAAWLKEIDGK